MKANNILKKYIFVPNIPKDKTPFPVVYPPAHTLNFTCFSFLINELRLVMLPHRILIKSRWDKTIFIIGSNLGVIRHLAISDDIFGYHNWGLLLTSGG